MHSKSGKGAGEKRNAEDAKVCYTRVCVSIVSLLWPRIRRRFYLNQPLKKTSPLTHTVLYTKHHTPTSLVAPDKQGIQSGLLPRETTHAYLEDDVLHDLLARVYGYLRIHNDHEAPHQRC